MSDIQSITKEIAEERERQVETWGQQDWPSVGLEDHRRDFEKRANFWKAINDARAIEGSLSWDGIFLEETFEALAESDLGRRREELLQAAAVAAAEIEAIDRVLEQNDEVQQTINLWQDDGGL